MKKIELILMWNCFGLLCFLLSLKYYFFPFPEIPEKEVICIGQSCFYIYWEEAYKSYIIGQYTTPFIMSFMGVTIIIITYLNYKKKI